MNRLGKKRILRFTSLMLMILYSSFGSFHHVRDSKGITRSLAHDDGCCVAESRLITHLCMA